MACTATPGSAERLALTAALLGVVGLGGCSLAQVQRGGAIEPIPALEARMASSAPRYLFSITGPSRPLGVALSPAGDRVYVTESEGARETKVYDRQGRLLGALNPPDSLPAMRTPVYVAVSPITGDVFVSDRHAGTIYTYAPDGAFLGTTPGPDGPNASWAPLALGFDHAGDLLVTDVSPAGHRAFVFGPDGALLQRLDPEHAASGPWAYPNGIAADRHGRVAVADSNNGRILVLDKETGTTLLTIGRGGASPVLGLPRGLAIDDLDRLYVADTTNHHVMIYALGDNEAQLLASVGDQAIEDRGLAFPNGVALDHTARLYIADRLNDRVQVWTY